MAEEGQATASNETLTTPVAADPVARIAAMLQAEKAPPPPEQEVAQGTEEPEYIPDGSNQQVEGADQPEEQPAMAEIPLDQLEAIALEVTIKGDDGRDAVEKPTIKELREGYMRQKDYSRKTAEVARQREEVGEKVRQGIESERTQYLQTLNVLQNTLLETVAPELKNVDWNALAQNDAFEYVRLRNRADQIQQTLGSVQAKIAEVSAKQTAEQKAAQANLAAKAVAQLEQDIPGWNDTVYQSLMKEGQQYGFKAEEIGTWLDARSIKVLHDAVQYRKMQTPVTGKKVVVAPKVLKPGATQSITRTQAQGQEAMKRLQSSGSINDAAAAIRSRMK